MDALKAHDVVLVLFLVPTRGVDDLQTTHIYNNKISEADVLAHMQRVYGKDVDVPHIAR